MAGELLPTKIQISEEIYLSEPSPSDIPFLVKHLAEKEIYQSTLQIPYPYTEEDGAAFISLIQARKAKFQRLMDWAIRAKNHELIGMISFQGRYPNLPARDEIGFWLAKPYWGKGIMTRVLKEFIKFGFEHYQFRRLELIVFSFNEASCRVAEKCGFSLETIAEKAHFKDGQMIDLKVYVIENRWS